MSGPGFAGRSKEKCGLSDCEAGNTGSEDKTTVCLVMPMTKDKDRLEKAIENQKGVKRSWMQGKDAAFLTLSDPTVYATSMYIHQRIAGMGYRTSIVSGVPSFCAAAASSVSLGEKLGFQNPYYPASYDIESGDAASRNQNPHESREKDAGLSDSASRTSWMGCNGGKECGMAEEEHLWINAEDMPEHPGYYTLSL